jgi:hypothetical protein
MSFEESQDSSGILDHSRLTAFPVIAGDHLLQVFHLEPVFNVEAQSI